jgi:PEP-CTERM motif
MKGGNNPRMRKQSICRWRVAGLTALLLTLYSPQAKADSVLLTFEGVGDNQEVGNFYNGGGGGNLGISFGAGFVAEVAADHGGSGLFSNEPSPDSVVFGFGPINVNVMNVPAGFTTFSFFYSSFCCFTNTVSVWSGQDASGTMLGSITLLPNTDSCDTGNKFVPPFLFCNWTQAEIAFSGTAGSVDFSVPSAGFDDMALTTSTPTPAPEPATLLLLGVGSLGLAGLRRKKAA